MDKGNELLKSLKTLCDFLYSVESFRSAEIMNKNHLMKQKYTAIYRRITRLPANNRDIEQELLRTLGKRLSSSISEITFMGF